MKPEAMTALDQFFDECHAAPPTPRREPGRGSALTVPAVGLTLGIAAALLVSLFPAAPAPEAARQTAQALADRQLRREEKPDGAVGSRQRIPTRWTV
ncbi:MAG TPA: hypothetical protein VKT78_15740 [Fimbriimonadaceae bacterium]|nr:hypothetical protein [Fimbriimonadaceae bacterium]